MILPSLHRRVLAATLVLAASLGLTRAQYTAGQSANQVWGQSSFTTVASPVTAVGTLRFPFEICTDPTTGKFFVADAANNRVLRYASSAAYVNGAAAEAVFGQADYATNTSGGGETGMSAPRGLVVDPSGTLWVADTDNNRVLRFNGASSSSQVTARIKANAVLGQPDFTMVTPNTSQRGMKKPRSVGVDPAGNLYVADEGNNRVLKFNKPNGKANYGLADSVIGQNNFEANSIGVTPSTLNGPEGVAFDSAGDLWVSDANNSRLLFYPASSLSLIQGAAATVVLGQINFTSKTTGTTAATLNTPNQICLDPLDRLYVADSVNSRVLVYENPSTRGSGANASFVLGQPNFTTNTAGTTQAKFNTPRGVTFSQNLIFVIDNGNNRMLNFAINPGLPFFKTPPSDTKINPRGPRTFAVMLNNQFGGDDKFKVKVVVPSATKKLATISFRDASGTDITSQLLSGNYVTPLFGPKIAGGTFIGIKVRIEPKPVAYKGDRFTIKFQASSITSPSITTQKDMKAKFKKVTPKTTK